MQSGNKKEPIRKSWESKPGTTGAKAKPQKPKSDVDIAIWKSLMPEELKGLIDESKFCEMCSDFDTDLQFFPSSSIAQKQTFGVEHLALLIEQLLSDDSKTVARAANALNGLATGNESVSAAIRIKLLADPSALNNIFHVRLPAPFPTPLPQERLTPPLHAFPRRRRPSSRPRRPGGSSSRSAPRSAQVPRRAAPRRAVRPVTRPAARALQAQILLAPRGFSEQSN